MIGVPDERYGEELMAWVVLRSGATLSDEELREFCKGRIAHYKIPRYVKFVDAFPMTVTGKVQKFRMRESAIEELGLGAGGGGRRRRDGPARPLERASFRGSQRSASAVCSSRIRSRT